MTRRHRTPPPAGFRLHLQRNEDRRCARRFPAPCRPWLGLLLLALAACALPGAAIAADDAPWKSGDFAGLAWRGIGPAIASGRVADFAVDPADPFHWYVAVCSGGVWETPTAA